MRFLLNLPTEKKRDELFDKNLFLRIDNKQYKNMEKKETYNKAVDKLRAIVEDIERGELDVDVLSEKVKEATRLIKLCKEKLFKADEEVKKILEELS